MNAKTSTAVVAQDAPVVGAVSRMMKRVIIQRPSGNSDDSIFLGFNSFEGSFPFDTPVELPADMVDYMRSQKRVEFRPGEKGQPLASYTSLITIVDAPQEALNYAPDTGGTGGMPHHAAYTFLGGDIVALARIDTLLKHCLPELPAAPEPVISDALLSSIRLLCSESSVWETTQAITILVDYPSYVLAKPSPQSSVWFVKDVRAGANQIMPVMDGEEYSLIGVPAGTLTRYRTIDPDTIDFMVLPSGGALERPVSVTAIWMPTLDAEEFPAELLDRYRDAIVAAAKGFVMRIPNQIWSNPQLGMQYEMTAKAMRNAARLDRMHARMARSFEVRRAPFGSL